MMRIFRKILVIPVLAVCVNVAGQSPNLDERALMHESQVWDGGENDKTNHRILGLTLTGSGAILAFSEARVDGKDEGPHDLVCKRSEDNGKSWSSSIVIERCDGSFWKENGRPGKLESWANPAALTDSETGRIFIFYVLNEGEYKGRNTQRMTRVFYKTSDDEGRSWSERTEITHVLNTDRYGRPNVDAQNRPRLNEDGFACDYLGRPFHMPGPGHGIQLRNGRLMLQFWHRRRIANVDGNGTYVRTPSKERYYGASVIYSDDHGKTWKHGGHTGVGKDVTESRIVELSDGTLMLNARINSRARRWVAISKDQGLTWKEVPANTPEFTAIDCGLIRITPPAGGGSGDWLLFSHLKEADRRSGMVVSLSMDGGNSWPHSKLIYPDRAMYSDLVRLQDGTFGLLYEKTYPEEKGAAPSEISFIRFNYLWLMEN